MQSALLEAMAERQVSIGRETYPLPELFLVMATQNPIEQEGTYPLPEAQLDRFLMHVKVDYPNAKSEHEILNLVRAETVGKRDATPPVRLDAHDIFEARRQIIEQYMAPGVEEYLIQLVMATRNPGLYQADLVGWLDYGASPRGTIALDQCSRAVAWLDGRNFVTPDDVRSVAHDALRHRIITSFEAEAQGVERRQAHRPDTRRRSHSMTIEVASTRQPTVRQLTRRDRQRRRTDRVARREAAAANRRRTPPAVPTAAAVCRVIAVAASTSPKCACINPATTFVRSTGA